MALSQGEACIGEVCIGNPVDGVREALEGVKGAAETAGAVAAFWSDPFGNTFRALQVGAHSLATDVLPMLTHATMPDLTAEWWLRAYAVSFALAIFVLAILMIPSVLATARGRQSGEELFETFTLYVPLFLIGATFGPLLGLFLVRFFGVLTDSLAAWGIVSSADEVTAEMTRMLADGDPSGIAGGAAVGIFIMLLMLAGLVLVVLMLVVQLVTLYFTGILFPLGWLWIGHYRTRGFGYKIPFVWLGVLASHPLLFLLLGAVYMMMAAQVTAFEDAPRLERLVSLAVSAIAMIAAGTSPLLMFMFAPVLPFGSNPDGPERGASAPIGDQDLNETTRRHPIDSTDAGVEDSWRRSRGSDEGSGTAPTTGPSVGRGADAGAGGSGATGPTSTSDVGGEGSQGEPGADVSQRSSPATGAPGVAAEAGAVDGTQGAAGAGAAEGAEGGAAAAAEAGAVATGIGAVVAAAAIAAQEAVDGSQEATQMAAGDVESFDGYSMVEDR